MFRKSGVNAGVNYAATGFLQRTLNPKAAGLTGENKPKVVILNSSLDAEESGSAVDFGAAKKIAEERGCKVINRGELTYDVETGLLSSDNIIAPSFSRLKQGLIIWFEVHGAPSWVFGSTPDFATENRAVKLFNDCLLRLEATTGLHIDTVIINSCYSATEIFNEENGSYSNSSARLLSILLPDRNIIGFIARNSSAKITGIFETANDPASFKPCTIPLVEGSILFRNGVAIEYSARKFYCVPQDSYVKPFILETCSIADPRSYLRICPAREEIATLRRGGQFDQLCYADKQIEEFEAVIKAEKDVGEKKAKR